MRIFKKKENRAEPSQEVLDSSVVSLLSEETTVTREQVLQIPTVQACINKISSAISMLPIRLYKKNGKEIEEVLDDVRLNLLNNDTKDTLNPPEMWKAVIRDYYTGRGGWVYADRDQLGKVQGLYFVDSDYISLFQNNDPIFKTFLIQVNGKEYFNFEFIKLLRTTKDGYTNIPIQQDAGNIILATYNSLMLEISMSRGGGCKGGFLKSKNKLSKDTIEDIREGYTDLYTSFNNKRARKILVLNDGMDFQEISSTAAEMQINENKKTNSSEVCKLFGFPHTIIDGGATEEDRRQFNQVVVSIINQIESELDNVLLLEIEKENGYYFAFDVEELIRGSQKERYEAYEIALRNRFMQIDEVRDKEDLEPLGFDFVTLGLGDVLLNPKTREVYTPNTNQTSTLGGDGNENREQN